MRQIHPRIVATLATTLLATAIPPTLGADPAVLPPLTDVLEYRADAARSSIYPGPGPIDEPVLVWSRAAAGAITSTPILADGLVLAGDDSGIFYALDGRTGDERWRFDAGSAIATGVSASDGTVAFSDADGVIHAVDLATGAERWNHPGSGGNSIVIVDGTVYVSGDEVVGLDLADGSERWTWSGPAPTQFLAVAGETLYASVNDGRLYALSLADGTERWHVQTISPTTGPAMVTTNTVYLMTIASNGEKPDGELYAIDPDSGEIRWRFRGPSGGQIGIGPVADGVEYAGSVQDGLFAMVEEPAEGGSPQVRWHTDLPGSGWRSAALVGDVLYVPTRDPGAILAVDPSDGSLLWSIPLVDGTPGGLGLIVSGGMIFTGDGGSIVAYAEPDLAAAIGPVSTGPLTVLAEPDIARPPNPFTVIGTLDPSTTGLQTMLSLDVGPDGLIYALDMKPSVTVIDPATSSVVRSWGRLGTGKGEFDLRVTDGNPGMGDIDVGADGTVLVADSGNHRLQAFTPDGTFIRQIGSFGTEDGQFSRPSEIAVDDEGSVYAVDGDLLRLTKFDRDGVLAWSIPAVFPLFHDVVHLTDGRIAWLGETGAVATLDPATGDVLDQWGEPGLENGQIGNGCDISVDGARNVYILSCAPDRTQVFDPEHRFIGGAYTPQDKSFLPAFGPNGEVYATDWFASDTIYILNVDLSGS